MDAYQILVIILASALSIFLVLLIVSTVLIIKILGNLRRITAKAEAVADKVEHIGAFFEKTAGPVAIANLVSNIAKSVMQVKSSRKGKRDE